MATRNMERPQKKGEKPLPDTGSIRDAAEQKLGDSPGVAGKVSGLSPEQLIHELQVHQIELEMQAEELRRSQLALEESRDKYLDLYDFAPLGYLTLSHKALITEVNLTGALLLGTERNKLVNARFSSFMAEKDADTWHLFFMNVLKEEKKRSCTLTLVRRDGYAFPARLESIRMAGTRGPPTVRVALNDITDIREAEESMRESEEKYRGLFAAESDGIMVIDGGTGTITDCNTAFSFMHGYRKDELIGRHYSTLSARPDAAGAPARELMQFIPVRHHRRKDGHIFPVEITSSVVSLKGNESIIAAIRDITRRVRIEEELARRNEAVLAANEELTTAGEELKRNEARLTISLEEKEVLLSEIHHRVKNNLAAFISLLSLDGTYEETDAGRRLRKDLQNRARSMALIHETLYKTRKFSAVDMGDYLSTLIEQIAGTYKSEKVITTVVHADGVTLDLARATPCGLIVNELITNAFKYAFPASFDCGSVRDESCMLRVSLSLDHGMYTLTVGDNGIGLPDAYDPQTAKSLGLKLVNFLSRHQLRAKVEVIRENGTEFRIRFKEKESSKDA